MGSEALCILFMISNLDYSHSHLQVSFRVHTGQRQDSLYKYVAPEILIMQSLVNAYVCLES